MDFREQIKQLGERVSKLKGQIETEEATKNAFIMPFIQILGYDVFNPIEVVPEHTCDIGTKKGEKIDYAIQKDNEPIILIECKHWDQNLNLHDNQLLRYFGVSKAKFGVLTNGIIYRFYTDLEKNNIMDQAPFLELDITNIKNSQIEELKKFHKSHFDEQNILDTASDLKYTNEIRSLINVELNNPSEALVRIFARQVYGGQLTAKYLEYFTQIFKTSFNNLVNELINERLKSALKTEEDKVKSDAQDEMSSISIDRQSLIETTEEELQSFFIVRSILYNVIDDINRVVHRDTQSYFGILLDNNNRKPICRLHLNGGVRYIELFDENKKGERHLIESLDDIYKYSDIIRKSVSYYD